MADRQIIQVALRLSPDMHGKLKAMADEDRRSLHAEILTILDRAIEEREAQPDAKLAA
jgi:hypothetical protein